MPAGSSARGAANIFVSLAGSFAVESASGPIAFTLKGEFAQKPVAEKVTYEDLARSGFCPNRRTVHFFTIK